MRSLYHLILVLGLFCLQTVAARADGQLFMATAFVPTVSGTTMSAYKVTGGSELLLSDVLFDFGTLEYDGKNRVWFAPSYFHITVAAVQGVSPNVTVAYKEGYNPNGNKDHALGAKTVITFTRLTATGQQDLMASHPMQALKDIGDVTVTPAELGGDSLNIALGVYTGSPVVAGAEPFTNVDIPGHYTGTLIVTSTIQ